MEGLKIKKKYIGSKVFQPILGQMILIEEGKEEKYYKLGLDIFTKRMNPVLQKKTTRKRKKK